LSKGKKGGGPDVVDPDGTEGGLRFLKIEDDFIPCESCGRKIRAGEFSEHLVGGGGGGAVFYSDICKFKD
jgi:hypothetical protein